MRKLVMMAALLAAGSVHANGSSSTQQAKETGQTAASDVKQGASEAKDWSKDQASKAGAKADQMQTTAQESGKTAEHERDQLKKDSFDLKGQVSKVSSSELTVSRKDAPTATLHVDHSTKIELDGKQASLSQLQPGQDVKASFNLKGDKPTAIEIKAEKTKAEKSSEKSGTSGTSPSTAPGSAPTTK